ncbi:MAG: hypothetical protein ACNA7Q_03205, partial [Rhodobacterales bacterium]
PEAEVAALLRNSAAQDQAQDQAASGHLPETPAASHLLGWPDMDTRHAELFAISDLTGLGLPGYLTEGLGLDDDQIAPDHARLSALAGYVLIVLSRAFNGKEAVIHIPQALTLIGTYREKAAPIRFDPLPGTAARGVLTGPAAEGSPDQARRILRVAALSALILMLLAIGLVAILGGGAE